MRATDGGRLFVVERCDEADGCPFNIDDRYCTASFIDGDSAAGVQRLDDLGYHGRDCLPDRCPLVDGPVVVMRKS